MLLLQTMVNGNLHTPATLSPEICYWYSPIKRMSGPQTRWLEENINSELKPSRPDQSLNNELENIWKEVVVALSGNLPRHLPGGTVGNLKNPQSGYPLFRERSESRTSWIQVYGVISTPTCSVNLFFFDGEVVYCTISTPSTPSTPSTLPTLSI
jgi:hypothetical protein